MRARTPAFSRTSTTSSAECPATVNATSGAAPSVSACSVTPGHLGQQLDAASAHARHLRRALGPAHELAPELDGGGQAGEARPWTSEAPSCRRAPGQNGCALAAEVARVVARSGDLEALLEAVGQPQEADAVRPAQPFLARPRVGIHAQRGGIDVDRADALGAVHQHGRAGRVRGLRDLAQRQDAAVRPEHVRERDEPRARADQRGDRIERVGAVQRLGDAHDDAVAARERRERLEQARVLVVGRHDLVAGRERRGRRARDSCRRSSSASARCARDRCSRPRRRPRARPRGCARTRRSRPSRCGRASRRRRCARASRRRRASAAGPTCRR